MLNALWDEPRDRMVLLMAACHGWLRYRQDGQIAQLVLLV